MNQKQIYLIVAHPNLAASKANKALLEKALTLKNVTVRNLYADYPNFKIDVKREQAEMEKADAIVFQFPLYWYSTPSLMKEWQDSVFTYGWAFGSQGSKLKDKTFSLATTVGSPEKSYIQNGENIMDKILFPLYGSAQFCSMKKAEPFIHYGLGRPSDEELVKMSNLYAEFLSQL